MFRYRHVNPLRALKASTVVYQIVRFAPSAPQPTSTTSGISSSTHHSTTRSGTLTAGQQEHRSEEELVERKEEQTKVELHPVLASLGRKLTHPSFTLDGDPASKVVEFEFEKPNTQTLSLLYRNALDLGVCSRVDLDSTILRLVTKDVCQDITVDRYVDHPSDFCILCHLFLQGRSWSGANTAPFGELGSITEEFLRKSDKAAPTGAFLRACVNLFESFIGASVPARSTPFALIEDVVQSNLPDLSPSDVVILLRAIFQRKGGEGCMKDKLFTAALRCALSSDALDKLATVEFLSLLNILAKGQMKLSVGTLERLEAAIKARLQSMSPGDIVTALRCWLHFNYAGDRRAELPNKLWRFLSTRVTANPYQAEKERQKLPQDKFGELLSAYHQYVGPSYSQCTVSRIQPTAAEVLRQYQPDLIPFIRSATSTTLMTLLKSAGSHLKVAGDVEEAMFERMAKLVKSGQAGDRYSILRLLDHLASLAAKNPQYRYWIREAMSWVVDHRQRTGGPFTVPEVVKSLRLLVRAHLAGGDGSIALHWTATCVDSPAVYEVPERLVSTLLNDAGQSPTLSGFHYAETVQYCAALHVDPGVVSPFLRMLPRAKFHESSSLGTPGSTSIGRLVAGRFSPSVFCRLVFFIHQLGCEGDVQLVKQLRDECRKMPHSSELRGFADNTCANSTEAFGVLLGICVSFMQQNDPKGAKSLPSSLLPS